MAQLIPGPAFRPHGAYEALRANSRSMRSLSKPTIQLPPILITGTPVCSVLRTISHPLTP